MRIGNQFWIGALALGLTMPATAAAQVGQPPRQGKQSPPPQTQQQPAQAGQPQDAETPQRPPAGSQAERVNLVARVNGQAITQTEFRNNVQSTLQSQQRMGEPEPAPQDMEKIHQQVLDGLIESRLVEQFVLENGPTVNADEIDAVLRSFEQQLQTQKLTLAEYLESTAQTKDHLRNRIKGSLAWQKFQQEKMSPENLRQFYQQHQEQFGGMSYEEAQQQVSQLYVQALWSEIVAKMKPQAEIEIVGARPTSPQRPPRQPVR